VFLATDLDGTFLAGRQADRLTLYRALRARDDITLAYVTGRGVESVIPLLRDPLLPTPKYVIADVGATVVDTDGLRPVQPLQGEIDRRWVGVQEVARALGDIPGVVRQRVPQERRCSFFVDDVSRVDEVRRRLEELECDVLLSAGRYLDVLPAGVSKGATLRSLASHLDIDDGEVLVAGDTLNDLSMYAEGFPGVVVGGAERALTNATIDFERVYHAEQVGAGGILEGARAFGTPIATDTAEPSTGGSQLVVVYHRLPFEEKVEDGVVTKREPSSPNGIIPTLLGSFAEGRPGTWVAWSSAGEEAQLPERDLVNEERYSNLVAARVPLSEHDVRRFYKRFSKEAFWPLIFSFVERAKFSGADWEHYCSINRRFAERAAAEADHGALVWVHDYNLWMVPGYLRRLRPDVRIGFFHHTSLPPADVFNVIPWASHVVGSLVQCDYLGFHVPRYVANFMDVLQSHVPVTTEQVAPCAPRFRVHGTALGVPTIPTRIRVGDRSIALGAHPVGVNVPAIRQLLETAKARTRVRELRERMAGIKIVLSVERLDYVKGPIQKLEAFESLLEEHPELRGEVTLLFVTTPPAAGMDVYTRIREHVDQTVGRINGRFGTLEWTPVLYQYRSIPFDEVLTYYAAADVGWITPLRDGLNLVAKEYVVAQQATGGDGVLILSEFAGAAVELHGAILTNPYDVEGLRDSLASALALPQDERRQQMHRLGQIVEQYDVAWWSGEVLRTLSESPVEAPAEAPALVVA